MWLEEAEPSSPPEYSPEHQNTSSSDREAGSRPMAAIFPVVTSATAQQGHHSGYLGLGVVNLQQPTLV